MVKDRKEVLDIINGWLKRLRLLPGEIEARGFIQELDELMCIRESLIKGDFIDTAQKTYIFFQRAGGNVDILKGFIDGTCFGKGIGYASESTFLGNFLRAGEDFQEPPTLVCKLYAYKHVDFLIRMEQIGTQHGPDGLVERCGDIILYSGLGYAIQQLGH